MKRLGTSIIFFVYVYISATAQLNSYPESYVIEKEDIAKAVEIINRPLGERLVLPNPHPKAQWFPGASLGLFMHWGIHSVAGAQPSWDMVANFKYGGRLSPPDKYYALADQFDPQSYEPGKWMQAAKDAGVQYAVLTTKHHDGYALWPSKYGIGTKQYMDGRDLLMPYVAACRENGLKVGFYFSPRDWHFPGLMHPTQFDVNTWDDAPPVTDHAKNQKDYETFLGFVLTQIEELLTRYGKIDVLWLDGMSFNEIGDMHTEQVYAWIRSIQPNIVINDRWSRVVNPDGSGQGRIRFGDFTSPFKCKLPTYIPSKWWEHFDIWTGGHAGWGHDVHGSFKPYQWFFEHLVTCRALGGNFLPNVGPSGEGEMHPNYYATMGEIGEWMKHSKESVIGCEASPGHERSNVLITTRDNA